MRQLDCLAGAQVAALLPEQIALQGGSAAQNPGRSGPPTEQRSRSAGFEASSRLPFAIAVMFSLEKTPVNADHRRHADPQSRRMRWRRRRLMPNAVEAPKIGRGPGTGAGGERWKNLGVSTYSRPIRYAADCAVGNRQERCESNCFAACRRLENFPCKSWTSCKTKHCVGSAKRRSHCIGPLDSRLLVSPPRHRAPIGWSGKFCRESRIIETGYKGRYFIIIAREINDDGLGCAGVEANHHCRRCGDNAGATK